MFSSIKSYFYPPPPSPTHCLVQSVKVNIQNYWQNYLWMIFVFAVALWVYIDFQYVVKIWASIVEKAGNFSLFKRKGKRVKKVKKIKHQGALDHQGENHQGINHQEGDHQNANPRVVQAEVDVEVQPKSYLELFEEKRREAAERKLKNALLLEKAAEEAQLRRRHARIQLQEPQEPEDQDEDDPEMPALVYIHTEIAQGFEGQFDEEVDEVGQIDRGEEQSDEDFEEQAGEEGEFDEVEQDDEIDERDEIYADYEDYEDYHDYEYEYDDEYYEDEDYQDSDEDYEAELENSGQGEGSESGIEVENLEFGDEVEAAVPSDLGDLEMDIIQEKEDENENEVDNDDQIVQESEYVFVPDVAELELEVENSTAAEVGEA